MTRIITTLAEVSGQYDAAFVDLWGCMHNGLAAFPEAVAALRAFRAQGGKVVFVTNAPRPRASLSLQFGRLGIPEDCYDTIATSGDAARVALFRGAVGRRVWFMGEAHDLSFFDVPRIVTDPVAIERVPLGQAEGIVCCGPFDPHADPAVNLPDLTAARDRGLKLLCANPDIHVDRGETREWCAGALAGLYQQIGGESLYFGKPHAPIYDLARQRLAAVADVGANPRILCIGDGIGTDILGAADQGLDSLFITGGLAAAETLTATQPDPDALRDWLAGQRAQPTYSMGFLR